jgi:G3E family GTPase
MISPVPVTILTGFLGSGKTTLLNRILNQDHGYRIAVIENEFGEEGIDNELLIQEREQQILEMNNGCICCTVRGDLLRILGDLNARRLAGTAQFDHVIIETTGLADPAPVAQTFFVDHAIGRHYRLDGILTVVDAKHAPAQLDEHHEAQEQIGFADRILISKSDLVSEAQLAALRERIVAMNPRAKVLHAHFGQAPLSELLDIRGFSLDAILNVEPDFLDDVTHEHDDDVKSFVYRNTKPLAPAAFESFFANTLKTFGPQMMRYKGILDFVGAERRAMLQGVHMMLSADLGPAWRPDEQRETKIVFIGKDLPVDLITSGLDQCVQADASLSTSI